jgi:hypothetical protein
MQCNTICKCGLHRIAICEIKMRKLVDGLMVIELMECKNWYFLSLHILQTHFLTLLFIPTLMPIQPSGHIIFVEGIIDEYLYSEKTIVRDSHNH